MQIVLLIILVLVNAIEDAFRDEGKKELAHLFNTLHIAGWFCMMSFPISLILVVQYVLARFALFDITYNLMRGIDLFYIGSTSIYDKLWRWFGEITGFPMN